MGGRVMVRRVAVMAGLVTLVAALPGVGLAQGSASPSPSVGASPGAEATFGAAPAAVGSAVITDALAVLSSADSFRWQHGELSTRDDGPEIRTSGTTINGDPFRSWFELRTEGEVGWQEIQVGGEAWRTLYGSGWYAKEGDVDAHPGPLGAWAATLMDIADAGVVFDPPKGSILDGRPAWFYAGETTDVRVAPASSPPADTATFDAVLDLWVDAATGRLASATMSSARSEVPWPGADRVAWTVQESIGVSDVDDAANTVEPPALGPIAAPSVGEADPALAADVIAALDALAAADSWRARTETVSLGLRSAVERVVVRTPEPAAEIWNLFDGQRRIGVLAIGDEVWTALAPGPWQRQAGPPADCFGGPCDLAGLIDLGAALRLIAPTFRELTAPGSIDGVPVRHLRSTVGTVGPNGPIPGTTDLWISKETGIPIRMRFDGDGLLTLTTIGGVNDPANAVSRPE